MECPTYSAWSPEEAEYALQGIGNCDDRSAYLQLCADLKNLTEGGNTALALVEPRHPLWQLRMMSIRTILGVGPDAGVEEIASAARRCFVSFLSACTLLSCHRRRMDRCERGDVEPFCCENSGRDLGREGVGGRECRAGTVPSGHFR